jgi:hypothetical protein
MNKPAKTKKEIHPIEGMTEDPAKARLLDLIKARDSLAAERGNEQLIAGMTREKHVAEMRERGATEEYISFIYESAEKK